MEETKMKDKFKATKLWNAMIEYLRNNVSSKKCWYRLRSYENSFTGMEIVDAIYKFLTEDGKNYLNTKKIERCNAVKVAQVLMKQNIFKQSGNSKNGENLFEDSSAKFYQFCDLIKYQLAPLTNTTLQSVLQTSEESEEKIIPKFYDSPTKIISNPYNDENLGVGSSLFTKSFRSSTRYKYKPGSMMKTLKSLTSLVKNNKALEEVEPDLDSVLRTKIKKTPSEIGLKRSWTVASLDTNPDSLRKKKLSLGLSSALTAAVWKKLALARLLTVIEVPYLEDILVLLDDQSTSKDDTIFSNPCLHERNPFDDEWLSSAQACIDVPVLNYKPKNGNKMYWKKSAFKAVLEHYSKEELPLIPNSLQNIFVSILRLLKENNYSCALQAAQFTCLLLPWHRRNKLEQLLRFFNVVSNDSSVQLNLKISNQIEACLKLGSFLLSCPLLGLEQKSVLICFLSTYCDIVFTPPIELRKEVEKIMKSVEEDDCDIESGLYFCEKVSPELYESERDKNTERALCQLLESKIKDTGISSTDKSRWMHKFHKHHPTIYDKYYKEFRSHAD